MTEEAAFLHAIRKDPADDTARLVYADWLTEHGREDRAEFIRVQVDLARRLPAWNDDYNSGRGACAKEGSDLCRLQTRVRLLWPSLWHLFMVPGLNAHITLKTKPVDIEPPFIHVRRGFVDSVTCSAADWLAHAAGLVAAHPITRVTLTDSTGWDARIAQFDSHDPDGTFGCSMWPRIKFHLPSNRAAALV